MSFVSNSGTFKGCSDVAILEFRAVNEPVNSRREVMAAKLRAAAARCSGPKMVEVWAGKARSVNCDDPACDAGYRRCPARSQWGCF